MSASPDEITSYLDRMRRGDAGARDSLFPLVYDELRRLASQAFRGRQGQTLQPTALVHEAYLHLAGGEGAAWESRAHFFAVASMAIRQILIQHARRRVALKRGGDRERLTLADVATPSRDAEVDLLALDEALDLLAARDERQARIVQLRFFGGLSVDEVAEVVGVSKTTVEGEWRMARAWLRRQLDPERRP
jgi:RNA polymerase sigma factor (TIGR02999 family)